MTERWRQVLQNYDVSDKGRIRNRITGHVSYGCNVKGYKNIRINGGKEAYYIHRLVAMAFLGAPIQERVINHKNGIKTDNRVENLEWCSQLHNIEHAKRLPNYQGKRKDRYAEHETVEILKLHYVYGLRAHEIAPLYKRSYFSVRKVLTQTHHLPKALSL